MRPPRFQVIVPVYNADKWLRRNLGILATQDYANYRVCVLNDASTDNTQDIAETMCARLGWTCLTQPTRQWALGNRKKIIPLLGCDDEDVLVIVDGDDALWGHNVLSRVAQAYCKGVQITYGQFAQLVKDGKWRRGPCRALTPDELLGRQFRELSQDQWIFSALRTYKYKLWKNIHDEDLRDPQSGEYFKAGGDVAEMLPMLEMAGHKVEFISDVLYGYNRGNPLCVGNVTPGEQNRARKFIVQQPKYNILED